MNGDASSDPPDGPIGDQWQTFDLEVELGQLFEALFRPVAHIAATFDGSSQHGSGFLIHPRILLTAAHVVTFAGYGKMNAAESVRIDFGDQLCSAQTVALPFGWLAKSHPWLDFAALRLEHDVCPAAVTFVLDNVSQVVANAAEILGFDGRRLPVTATRNEATLAYPLANSPGFSGAPISPGSVNGRPLAVGLHTRQTQVDGLGHGLMPTEAQLRAALQALGFV